MDLPRLTRSERLPQVLRAEAGPRRTGALALMAVGGPVEADGFEPGVFDALVQILEDAAPGRALDSALAALSIGRTDAPEATRRLRQKADHNHGDASGPLAGPLAQGKQLNESGQELVREATERFRVHLVPAKAACRGQAWAAGTCNAQRCHVSGR